MRSRALFTLVLLTTACGAAKNAPPPADLIGQARKLERDGQEDAAIMAYRNALAQNANSFDAQYGLARTLDLAGSYDEARQHFAKAIDLAPDGAKEQALRMMGIAWIFVGNVDEATRYFRDVFDRRVAAGNPAGAADEANELGRVSLELGRVDQAEMWYRTGHEMAGKEAGRAASQIDLADMRWAHAQARLAARRGLEPEARQQEAVVEQLLNKGGNEDQRIQYAYLRGYVEFYLGHYQAAVAELQKADQQDPFILFLLAEANEKLEQPDRARDDYRKVLASTSHAVNSAFVRSEARRRIELGRSEPGSTVMTNAVIAARLQFAFTIMFHYLFPMLTMGLGVLLALLKTVQVFSAGSDAYGQAARFWARIFAITFASGVVTGIPMEFQFGTNWARFSGFAGPVVGQTLFMEGVFAFFAESSFLGVFLFGERRVRPIVHWFSSVVVGFGAVLSGFFIVATDAWMQHPVGFRLANGRAELTSLWALLTNPYLRWQYPHVIAGSLVTASMVMAGTGAYYLLAKRDEAFGRLCVRVGVIAGLCSSLVSLFPTGSLNAERIALLQPAKTAAMEGLFDTQPNASIAIIGMPDTETRRLLDPIEIPGILSYLIYGSRAAAVVGLNDIAPDDRPPVEVTYYAYHIMVGLGTIFIAVFVLAAFLLWRGTLYASRAVLWALMLGMPFPYIANEAGWTVSEVGRQPWLIYGIERTAAGTSTNVSAGMTVFTLLGFMGLYLLIGALYALLFLRIVHRGPTDDGHGAGAHA